MTLMTIFKLYFVISVIAYFTRNEFKISDKLNSFNLKIANWIYNQVEKIEQKINNKK